MEGFYFDATYADGQTAKPHEVTARVERGTLLLNDRGTDNQRAAWPLSGIHLVGDPSDGQVPRLQNLDGPDRLTLDGPDADQTLKLLTAFCPNLHRHRHGVSSDSLKSILILVGGASGSVLILLFVIIPLLSGTIAARVPLSWEAKLGAAAEDQVKTLFGFRRSGGPLVCRDPVAEAALGNLALQMGAGTALRLNVKIRIWDLDIQNAFALPGERVVLFRGLIDEAKSPEEVAGVLAHELGHVAERHAMERIIQASSTSFLIGLMLGDVFGGAVVAGVGETLINGAHSRDAEREADAWAVDAMNRINVDARGMADFFDRLSHSQGDAEETWEYFSTHPLSADRAAFIAENATGRGQAFTPGEWNAIRSACDANG